MTNYSHFDHSSLEQEELNYTTTPESSSSSPFPSFMDFSTDDDYHLFMPDDSGRSDAEPQRSQQAARQRSNNGQSFRSNSSSNSQTPSVVTPPLFSSPSIDMMPRNRNGTGNDNRNGTNNNNNNNNRNGNNRRHQQVHPPPARQTHDQSQPDRDRGDVQVQIKSEEERALLSHLSTTPREEKVKTYVGPRNRIFIVPLDSLDKSPVLKALVSRTRHTTTTSGTTSSNNNSKSYNSKSYSSNNNNNNGNGNGITSGSGSESFIMHPELTKINADHFVAVQQFLIMDEYVPAIVSHPTGENVWPKRLDGLDSVDDYRREALKAASLYVLARRLGMGTLAALVVRKLVECGYQEYQDAGVGAGAGGPGRHPGSARGTGVGVGVRVGVGVKCLLEVARVVFARSLENENEAAQGLGGWVMGGEGKGKGKGKDKATVKGDEGSQGGEKDVLEEWLIDQLSSRLQTVMTRHAQLFFEIAQHGACVSREFEKRVLQRKVEMLERLGDVVLVEDDE
ncbi:hypothetical protein PV05_08719 [Exophiala xenobiotica]|uniref:Uncharacterized protein n=1 Tax=Exophiala xenobiotica TaxID=348802 RepID=A0A0D2EZG5_9EURO|nr:uncharacterized protein PV05_08719 [Exophiala xenobiotica]KIW53124.1 hypothetical protein PV05_08719 [Exophiala xenobiotica]